VSLADPDAPPRRPWPAAVVTAVAIALLVLAALSTAWLVTGAGVGFSLRELVACHAHGCDATPITRLPVTVGVRSGFGEAGLVTLIAIWASAGCLLLAVIPAIAGARSPLGLALARLSQLALVVALGGAVAYVLRQPGGTSATALELGRGFFLFAAGNVIGLTAAQMLGKLHRRDIPG
jgi:hypothetical protein